MPTDSSVVRARHQVIASGADNPFADSVVRADQPLGTSLTPGNRKPRDSRRVCVDSHVRIGVVMNDASDQIQFRRALGAAGDAVFCAQLRELVELVENYAVTVGVIDGRDGSRSETAAMIRTLKTRFPSLPVLVYCRFTRAGMRVALAAAKAGADDVIVRGCDDSGEELRTTLDAARASCAVSVLTEELWALIPPKALPLVQYCLLNGAKAPTVAGVAFALGTSRRTLVARAAEAGLPSPRLLIGWGRLIAAGDLLARSNCSVEQVAHRLGFGSASELRNMFRRYTGLRPRDVRSKGGVMAILTLFCRALVPVIDSCDDKDDPAP